MGRKWCFVLSCKNTSQNSPGKIFVTVPRANEIRKKKWFKAIGRPLPYTKSCFYCCEDHFNLEVDCIDYESYIKNGGFLRLKKEVVPRFKINNTYMYDAEPIGSSQQINKWCFVPDCMNTANRTPNKIFFRVPSENFERRSEWFVAVGRSPSPSNRVYFCCEDHFDLDNDAVDFPGFLRSGCNLNKLRLKTTAVPHVNVSKMTFEEIMESIDDHGDYGVDWSTNLIKRKLPPATIEPIPAAMVESKMAESDAEEEHHERERDPAEEQDPLAVGADEVEVTLDELRTVQQNEVAFAEEENIVEDAGPLVKTPVGELNLKLIKSRKGKNILVIDNYQFYRSHLLADGRARWRCSKRCDTNCAAQLFTVGDDDTNIVEVDLKHNHRLGFKPKPNFSRPTALRKDQLRRNVLMQYRQKQRQRQFQQFQFERPPPVKKSYQFEIPIEEEYFGRVSIKSQEESMRTPTLSIKSTGNDITESKRNFLLSVLTDLKEMNEKQKRIFKRKIPDILTLVKRMPR